jgi:hypothetical protein
MGKYKNVEIFSSEKESSKKFLFVACLFPIARLLGDALFAFTIGSDKDEPVFNLAEYVFFGFVWVLIILSYFIFRWLAYRTKVFPKIENREGLHFLGFFILSFLSIIITGVVLSI